jgi:hypothetical protein
MRFSIRLSAVILLSMNLNAVIDAFMRESLSVLDC